ncbi:Ras- protein Rab-7A [Gaertneriomyces sp. JEL0708]|nr:Ras- protein Rab-7A [Gaertneriomyces sp. JEL0708]
MPRRRNVSQSSSAPVLKVLLLGDGSVGKTSLRNQLIYNRFSPSYKATIGTDFVTKHLDAGGREVAMQIWDTAGQERFMSLGVAYYRGADACVLVYDVTNPKSLESLPKWMSLFIEQSGIPDPKTFCFIMVGNKTDLREERTVSKREGLDMARRLMRIARGEEKYIPKKTNVNPVYSKENLEPKAERSSGLIRRRTETLPESIPLDSRLADTVATGQSTAVSLSGMENQSSIIATKPPIPRTRTNRLFGVSRTVSPPSPRLYPVSRTPTLERRISNSINSSSSNWRYSTASRVSIYETASEFSEDELRDPWKDSESIKSAANSEEYASGTDPESSDEDEDEGSVEGDEDDVDDYDSESTISAQSHASEDSTSSDASTTTILAAHHDTTQFGPFSELHQSPKNLGHPHASLPSSTHSTPETSIPYFETSAYLAHRTTDPFLHIAATVRIPKFEFNMLADDEWNTDQDEPINVMETRNSVGRGCAC